MQSIQRPGRSEAVGPVKITMDHAGAARRDVGGIVKQRQTEAAAF